MPIPPTLVFGAPFFAFVRAFEDGHGVGDGLAVGPGVGVAVGAGVGVAVGAGVGVAVGAGVGVGVGRGVGVAVGAGVGAGVGVAVGAGVGVAVGAGVGVAVARGVGVAVGGGVGVGVAVGFGVAVGAGVGVAVGAGVGVGTGPQSFTATMIVPVRPFASRSVTVVVPRPTAATSNHDAGLPLTVGVLLLRAASATIVTTCVFADWAETIRSPLSETPSITPV
jgi:hypothetical protein